MNLVLLASAPNRSAVTYTAQSSGNSLITRKRTKNGVTQRHGDVPYLNTLNWSR